MTFQAGQRVSIYLRRSQKEKGQKHSLARQEAQIKSFCKLHGLVIDQVWEETESGMKDSRPVLSACLSYSKTMDNQPIVISSVSRLGRKLSTLARYFEDPNLSIIVAELGLSASFLQLSIHSIFASEERRRLASRTKAGMAAAKAANPELKFGNPRPLEAALPAAWEACRMKGKATVKRYGDFIVHLRNDGNSWAQIAKALNTMRIPTPSGKSAWNRSSVRYICKARTKEIVDAGSTNQSAT